MKISDVYDGDNQLNVDGWNRLPNIMKYFITSNQKLLVDKIFRKVKEKYGQAGIDDLIKTSGWRSVASNSACGGVSDSLHLFGLACDFAKNGVFKNNPIPTCCDLVTIDSGKCWHVQFKRK